MKMKEKDKNIVSTTIASPDRSQSLFIALSLSNNGITISNTSRGADLWYALVFRLRFVVLCK